MTSLCHYLSAQEIVNWVTRLPMGVLTPTTRRNFRQLVANSCSDRRRDKRVSSRRRRRCVLGITAKLLINPLKSLLEILWVIFFVCFAVLVCLIFSWILLFWCLLHISWCWQLIDFLTTTAKPNIMYLCHIIIYTVFLSVCFYHSLMNKRVHYSRVTFTTFEIPRIWNAAECSQ